MFNFCGHGCDKNPHQIEGSLFVLPRITVVLTVEGVSGLDDQHVKLIKQHDQLAAMAPGVGEFVIAAVSPSSVRPSRFYFLVSAIYRCKAPKS
jgi:hypothetical protein